VGYCTVDTVIYHHQQHRILRQTAAHKMHNTKKRKDTLKVKTHQMFKNKAIIDSRLRSRCGILTNSTKHCRIWRYTRYCASGRPPIGPMVWKHDVIRKTGSA